jgi:hypothetical protein
MKVLFILSHFLEAHLASSFQTNVKLPPRSSSKSGQLLISFLFWQCRYSDLIEIFFYSFENQHKILRFIPVLYFYSTIFKTLLPFLINFKATVHETKLPEKAKKIL